MEKLIGTCLPFQLRKEGIILLLRAKGFGVFPLKSGTKIPMIDSWDKASDEHVDRVIQSLPDYNVAIICRNGLAILDFEREADFVAFYGDPRKIMDETLVVKTAHGGTHVYLQTAGEEICRKIRFCKDHPIDILGTGGYAVAPTSVIQHSNCDRSKCHESGTSRYDVISSTYDVLVVEQFHESLQRRLEHLGWKTNGQSKPLRQIVRDGVPLGQRNNSAFRFSRYLIHYLCLDDQTAWEQLLAWNGRNKPSMSEDELRRILDSAHRYPYQREAHPLSQARQAFLRLRWGRVVW